VTHGDTVIYSGKEGVIVRDGNGFTVLDGDIVNRIAYDCGYWAHIVTPTVIASAHEDNKEND